MVLFTVTGYQERLSDLKGPYWGTYGIVYRVLQPLLVPLLVCVLYGLVMSSDVCHRGCDASWLSSTPLRRTHHMEVELPPCV